jgi:hypothetical protein
MVGADKLLKPQANWTEAQFADFYKQLGRPDAADGYNTKPILEKFKDIPIDQDKFKVTLGELHKIGLTDKQAAGVLEYYLGTTSNGMKEAKTSSETARNMALTELKQEYGAEYDAKIDLARSVVGKFGDEKLKAYLEETKLGDHPAMIRLFAKIGEGMLDDSARGSGSGLILGDATTALAEINQLKLDSNFQKALMNRGPGHQEAVDKWSMLHKKAFPEKK